MPFYKYVCHDCKQPFDHFAKSISNPSVPAECPNCKGTDVAQSFNTSFNAHYRGRGFYNVDYNDKMVADKKKYLEED